MHQERLSNHTALNEKIKLQPCQDKSAPSTATTIELQEKVPNALVRHPKKNYRPKHRSAPVGIKREVKHGEGGSKTMASNDDNTGVESLGVLKAKQLASQLSPKRVKIKARMSVSLIVFIHFLITRDCINYHSLIITLFL
ncbi:hypothetical protein MKX03_025548 [Papaver bracteatum]|nr:hypothetical protein MKX03_025548 [Papaver bracteatum]